MDNATASLARILHSGDYVCIEQNVALFDEHDEYDASGKLVRRFDRATLEEIARRSNNRELATGDLSPFGPGHTIPDQYDANRVLVRKIPETEQPPIWGYFRNYRVGPFGPQGKLAIQCEMWAKKEYANEAKEYPRRSVELWLEDGFIDWVALLKRTPRRDLGLLTNEKTRTYIDGQPVTVLRYSMGAYAMPLPTDPTSTLPQATDLSPEEMAMCDRMIKYMAGKGCFAMPSAMTPPAPPPAPVGTPPAAPVPHPAAGPAMPATEPKREELLSTAERLVRYERENAELKKKDEIKDQRLAALETENKLARYERDLSELHNQGLMFDVEEELKDCKEMTPEQFERHKRRIVERYARDPAHIPDVPVYRGRVMGEEGPNSISERHSQVALQYMRQHENDPANAGKSRDQMWEEAVEKTRGK